MIVVVEENKKAAAYYPRVHLFFATIVVSIRVHNSILLYQSYRGKKNLVNLINSYNNNNNEKVVITPSVTKQWCYIYFSLHSATANPQFYAKCTLKKADSNYNV
jgi:hypothetical protein